jgi:hypothetical protein
MQAPFLLVYRLSLAMRQEKAKTSACMQTVRCKRSTKHNQEENDQ